MTETAENIYKLSGSCLDSFSLPLDLTYIIIITTDDCDVIEVPEQQPSFGCPCITTILGTIAVVPEVCGSWKES